MADAPHIESSISVDFRRRSWLLFGVMALVVLIYYPVLSVGMISDDFLHTKNISSWDSIWREQGGWTFRFVGNLIFWLDGVIWRGDFTGRHLGSIILQLFNITIAFGIAKRLFAQRGSAILCTAIYAFHFGNVNSVAWPADKWTLSAATFIFLGFWFSLRYFERDSKRDLLGALFSFSLGLLTKEIVVMLLPILLFFQWTQGKRLSDLWKNNHLRAFYLLLTSVLTLYLIYRFGFAEKVIRQGFTPGGVYTISPVKILLGFPFYVTYSFVPFDYFELFHLDPEAIRIFFKSQLNGPLPYLVFGTFAVAAVLVCVKSIKYWDRNLLFGVGWFFMLVLTFVFWFDIRWLNPATFGVAIVLTSIVQRLRLTEYFSLLYPKPVSFSLRKICYGLLLVILLISLSAFSVLKVHQWVENGALVKQILNQTKELKPNIKPHSFIAFLNIPDQINQVQVFRNGIEQALQNEYSDFSITVSYNSQIFEGLIAPEQFCEYIKKYKNLVDASRKRGGEILLLYFDFSTKKVRSFKCGDL